MSERQRETEIKGLISLNDITCRSTANCLSLRVQQQNYIYFIYVGKRAVCRMHYKSITIYNAWDSSQRDYLIHKQAATFYFVKFESQC